MSDHDSQLLRAVLQIQADVTVIKARQDETNKRLFGNGQPGEIERLDSRLKTLELADAKESGERASSRRWAAYISALVSAAITFLGMLLHRK